jgi:hypothetical protein
VNPLTDTPVNKLASLQGIYAEIARISVETNKPYVASHGLVRMEINRSAAETDDTLSSNVVYLSRIIARRHCA